MSHARGGSRCAPVRTPCGVPWSRRLCVVTLRWHRRGSGNSPAVASWGGAPRPAVEPGSGWPRGCQEGGTWVPRHGGREGHSYRPHLPMTESAKKRDVCRHPHHSPAISLCSVSRSLKTHVLVPRVQHEPRGGRFSPSSKTSDTSRAATHAAGRGLARGLLSFG